MKRRTLPLCLSSLRYDVAWIGVARWLTTGGVFPLNEDARDSSHERTGRPLFEALFLLGFATLFMFYMGFATLSMVDESIAAASSPVGARATGIATYCLAFALLCLVVFASARAARFFSHSIPYLVVTSVLAAAGVVLWEHAFPSPIVSALFSGVTMALFVSNATCSWAQVVCRLQARRVVILMLGAFVLSFALTSLRDAFGQLTALLAVLPLICGAAYCGCRRLEPANADMASSQDPLSSRAAAWRGAPSTPRPLPGNADVPVELTFLLIILYLASSFIRSYSIASMGDPAALPPSHMMTPINLALSVALLVLGSKLGGWKFFCIGWLASSVMVFLGLFACMLPVDGLRPYGSDIVALGRVFIISLIFVYAAYRVAGEGADPVRTFVGYVSLPYVAAVAFREMPLPWQAEEAFQTAVTLCCLALVIITVVLIARAMLRIPKAVFATKPEDVGTDAPDISPSYEQDAPTADLQSAAQSAVGILSQNLGLTGKESQVCSLLLRGYTLQNAADTLGVTLNTVRTHARAIYTKAGVHTRQELISMAELAEEKQRGDKASQ